MVETGSGGGTLALYYPQEPPVLLATPPPSSTKGTARGGRIGAGEAGAVEGGGSQGRRLRRLGRTAQPRAFQAQVRGPGLTQGEAASQRISRKVRQNLRNERGGVLDISCS